MRIRSFALLLFTLAAGCGQSAPESDGASASFEGAESVSEPVTATPAGLVPSRCVVEVSDTDRLDFVRSAGVRADGTTFSLPDCQGVKPLAYAEAARPELQPSAAAPVATMNGWLENARVAAPWPVRKLTATWRVPRLPYFQHNGQTIFLFPGLQQPSGEWPILQTVLQYDNGATNWSLQSWVGPINGVVYSSHALPAAPNELIFGSIEASNCGATACDWVVTTTNMTHGRAVSVVGTLGRNYSVVIGGALAVRNVTDCSALPASTTVFDNIAVYDMSGARHNMGWQHYFDRRECGMNITSDTNTVHLYYD